jgi:hypothetical protein
MAGVAPAIASAAIRHFAVWIMAVMENLFGSLLLESIEPEHAGLFRANERVVKMT